MLRGRVSAAVRLGGTSDRRRDKAVAGSTLGRSYIPAKDT